MTAGPARCKSLQPQCRRVSASSTALRVSASPAPANSKRAARLTWSRQPARPAGGIARPALANRPRRSRNPLFLLFYLVEIRHRQLLK